MENPNKTAHEAEQHTVSEETWHELLGTKSWEGLLEPLDINLRKFILRCGDFCHAANDAFTVSANGNTPAEVVLPDCCQFHSHLYAFTSLSVEKVLHFPAQMCPTTKREHVPNWMGYCASTTDEVSNAIGRREIYIAWRGTKRLFEWMNNLKVRKTSAEFLLRNNEIANRREKKEPKIVNSWLSIYTSTGNLLHGMTSARDRVKAEVGKLLEKYEGEKISIVVTGHSLGASLAVLTAFDLAENQVGEEIRVAAVVFGCPRVGNKAFSERVNRHSNLKILHVRNKKDIVTRLPSFACQLGTELVVDSRKSDVPLARDRPSHELEASLYTVAGWNGKHKPFELKISRSTDRLNHATKSFLYIKTEFKTWRKKMAKVFNFGDHDIGDNAEN